VNWLGIVNLRQAATGMLWSKVLYRQQVEPGEAMNGPVTRLPSPIPVRLSLGGNFLLWDLSPGPGETFGPIPRAQSASR